MLLNIIVMPVFQRLECKGIETRVCSGLMPLLPTC